MLAEVCIDHKSIDVVALIIVPSNFTSPFYCSFAVQKCQSQVGQFSLLKSTISLR